MMFACAAVDGQVKMDAPPDSIALPTGPKGSQPKLISNHFIPQYPSSFWFVQCAMEDRAGNLWFGTTADGVYRFDGKAFTNFTREDGICNNDVLCMMEDDAGNIWFGTRGGVCWYNPSNAVAGKNRFMNIVLSENATSDPTSIASGSGFAENFVWSIMQDKAGKIWLGTNEGVYCYNPSEYPPNSAPIFHRFLDDDAIQNKKHLQLRVVQDIFEDKQGDIWFASNDLKGEGICKYDGRSLTNFKPDGVTKFRSIAESNTGDLLFLSMGQGVFRRKGWTLKQFPQKYGLADADISALLEDHLGALWLGMDHGITNNENASSLFRYDGHSLKRFSPEESIGQNEVRFLLEDKNGNIWIGTTNTGLFRYDGKTFTKFSE